MFFSHMKHENSKIANIWDLDQKEGWAPKDWCFWTVVLEKTLESPLDCKIQPVCSKGEQSWVFIRRTDAKAETPILRPPHAELTHWKRLWCWEGLEAGGEGDNGGWDGWMASPTQWMWVRASSRSWWMTWKPGVLQSMGSQRIRHDWVTELNPWNCGTPKNISSQTRKWYKLPAAVSAIFSRTNHPKLWFTEIVT